MIHLFAVLLSALCLYGSPEPLNVLVFSKTAGFRHDSIPAGISCLEKIAARNGWRISSTENPAAFSDENLAKVDVTVWLMTTGDVLDSAQQEAFRRFIKSGKGFVGIHSATITENDWPWFVGLVGAKFIGHPPAQKGRLVIENRNHPAIPDSMPSPWEREDEWYSFDRNPRGTSRVLVSIDESSYEVDDNQWFPAVKQRMGDHPLVWCQEYEGGRVFQTALGHTAESYADPIFIAHLEGAMLWAAGRAGQSTHPEPQTLAIGAKAPDFSLTGTDGKTWTLRDFDQHKLLVVVFSCDHCPTAQAYEDRLIRVCLDYQAKGVGLVMISPNSPKALNLAEMGYTDVGDTLEEMKIRARDRNFPFPYLYDGDDQKASIAFGPVATPHVFIFDEARRLQYVGRVDDKEKPGSGKAEDLRNALDALLSGKKPSPASTKVFGCSIKWAWKDEYTKQLYKEWAELPVNLEPVDLPAVKRLLANSSGKLRLINIWATWCAPCTAEFPELVKTDRMYRDRDFEFVSLSTDKSDRRDRALEFLKKNQASNKNCLFTGESIYPLIEEIDPAWQGALPYTLIVEPGGKIVYRCQGMVDPLALRKFIVGHPLIGRYY